jgi:peptide/nickel transport system ATP-binding protein
MTSCLREFQRESDDFLLEVRGLSIYLSDGERERPLLDDVSFQVKRGKFTALMGRSGVGKTLTLKAILGFLRPPQWRLEGDIVFRSGDRLSSTPGRNQTGSVAPASFPASEPKFCEKNILRNGEYVDDVILELRGKSIAAVFQGPDSHLHPSLTVGWQIGESIDPTRPWRETRETVEKRLREVKMFPEHSRRYPHQLSQGQRQRVLIAMALSHPELVIADEPTSALDDELKREIVGLLRCLRTDKKIESLLLITHDLEMVKELLRGDDQLIVMGSREGGSATIVERVELKHVDSPWCTVDGISLYGCLRGSDHILRRRDFQWLTTGRTLGKEQRMTPILRIEGLQQGYRQGLFAKTVMILQGVHLVVKEAEFLGVTGRSGCGKTTLVKCIARLMSGTRGKIYYYLDSEKRGQPCVELIKLQPDGTLPDAPEMRQLRKEIQVVFQDSASIFNPRMTIRELLGETLFEVAGMEDPSKRLETMAKSLLQLGICRNEREIDETLSKFPGELSGGERQRLALARVSLLRPRLVIADEPFADQDDVTREQLVNMMDYMRRQHRTTFIIVSHERRMIDNVCDRVVVLDGGKVVSVHERWEASSENTRNDMQAVRTISRSKTTWAG